MTERPETYRETLEEAGANWGEWNDEPVVRDFDEGDAEYWHIRRDGAGLVDRMARETLVVEGDEAVPWLQGLVTADLLDLKEEGAGQLSFATDVNGRVVSDLRILHLPNMLFADLEPGTLDGGLYTHLEQQIIMEDVELVARTSSTGRIGVYGSAAAEVVEEAGGWEHPVADLETFDGTWGWIGDHDVVVQRVRLVGGPGYELSFDRDVAVAVWEALERAGGDEVIPAGHQALETARIESGVPRFGAEVDEEIIPLEAELGEHVDFDKGCYTGQEVIARLDTLGTPAKKLRTLVFDGGAAPEVGAEVEDDERGVGEVVNSVWSPLLEAPVALAYVKRGSNEVGTTVQVEGRDVTVERLGHPLTRN